MLDLQSKVLDYGCGAATDLRRFSEIGFSQLYGFDIRENSRARSTLPRVDFRYGRLLADARYETGFFDLIMLNHVLEHIPTPLACLNEVVPLLKSGGYMMVAVPNIANWYLDLLCRNIMH